MHSLANFGAVSALLTLTYAIPADYSPLEKRGLAFRIDQSIPKSHKLSGPASLVKAYGKFNKAAPKDVKAAAAASDGTVLAIPELYDTEYLSPVSIGGQVLNLDFDTGSSDLWCYSSELPLDAQAGHSVYDPSISANSTLAGAETWFISYGDGSFASGIVYFDTVKVGETTVADQGVELAQEVSASFQSDIASDGLLGLAMDTKNTASPLPVKTFFSNAIPTLASPLFTVNLKKGAPGNYNFGYIDPSEYTGSITYVPVISTNGFWEFSGNGYSVGTGGFVSASIDAIADTGTTLLYLPPKIVSAYYAKVSGARYVSSQGGYIYPCSATLPSITIGIGNYKAVIPGSYITYAPATATTCYGGIQRNTGIGFSIFGDIFLKSQFVVFAMTSPPQLGFAAKPT